MNTIDKILTDLKPYNDKVVITPLSDEEIDQIQGKFSRKLPTYYIEFLKKIGLKQDLIWGLNDGIDRFADLSEFLPSEDYFRFGDNGGEDYWLLKFDDENDRTIYEYDYYCDGIIKCLEKTFDDLLIEGLEDIKHRYEQLTPNNAKDWCVQFSARTGSGKFLVAQLTEHFDLPIKIIKEPTHVETSAAGVKCYEGIIEIDGKEVPLTKQVIKGAGSSNLYFNWKESIQEMQHNSTIKKIDKALSKCKFKHVLIDYGILNRDDL